MGDFQLDWQVENLRLTAFPGPSVAPIQETNWWADIMGHQPENSIHRRRQGILRQSGQFEDGQLVLQIQPDRITWLFAPREETEEEISDLPIIGPFNEMLDIFLPRMHSWFELENTPSLSRLAFGAVFLYPVDSVQEGYQYLNRFLPFIESGNIEGASDFSYQINRPRDTNTEIEGLEINRLSKWSVITVRHINVTMSPASARVLPRREISACRLQLDVNTHQEFDGELIPKQLPEVFNELVEFGREIASDGDIA